MAKAKRKAISNKTRVEIFKRDKFTCQYCGRSAPEVILEIDHIKPVAEGGTNDVINLITSCRDCNRGKGKTLLDDQTVLEKQKKQLDELEERRQQLAMMVEWKEELLKMDESFLDSLERYYEKFTGYSWTEQGRIKIRKNLKKYSAKEVQEALEISLSTYFTGDKQSANYVMDKVGGICYNRKNRVDVMISNMHWEELLECVHCVNRKYYDHWTPSTFLEQLIDNEYSDLGLCDD